jgi:hypothetical protein
MTKIKGFSTKDKQAMLGKIQASGAKIKLPFEATPELVVDKNPFDGLTVENKKGKKLKFKKRKA